MQAPLGPFAPSPRNKKKKGKPILTQLVFKADLGSWYTMCRHSYTAIIKSFLYLGFKKWNKLIECIQYSTTQREFICLNVKYNLIGCEIIGSRRSSQAIFKRLVKHPYGSINFAEGYIVLLIYIIYAKLYSMIENYIPSSSGVVCYYDA